MVDTSLKYLTAFFRLIRWPNLIMVAFTQYLMRWCIVSPMLQKSGLSELLSEFDFFLLVFATVSITAAGYVINDYFDRRIDQVNNPDTVIVTRIINRRSVMAMHFILNFIGVIAGFVLVYKIRLIQLGLIFIGVSGILWFYSTTYKRQFLIGNLIVSALTGLVPLMVLIFEIPLLGRKYGSIVDAMGLDTNEMVFWIMSFSILAFLLTLIREIIKDAEDFEGDQAYGLQTIPIVAGIKLTKIIILSLITVLIITVIYILLYSASGYIPKLYLILLNLVPLVLLGLLTLKAETKKHYHQLSLFTKYIMVLGMLFALIVRFFVLI